MKDDEFGASGYLLAPIEQAEQDMAAAVNELLRARAVVQELGGRDIASERLVSVPGVLEGLLHKIGGASQGSPSRRAKERLAGLVADAVVGRLAENPSLVSRLNEFGEVGSAVAASLGLPYGEPEVSLADVQGLESAELSTRRQLCRSHGSCPLMASTANGWRKCNARCKTASGPRTCRPRRSSFSTIQKPRSRW